MDWVFDNVPVLIAFAVIYSIIKAVRQARAKAAEHQAEHNESDEQRRVREIQERIRRIAAERKGGLVKADQPHAHPVDRDGRVLRPEPPQLDPYGGPDGPVKRMLGELQRRVTPPPAPAAHANRAELERQQRLADEVRSLDEAKVLATRRAVKRAAVVQAHAESEGGQRTATRARVLEELHDPHSLRRAFILREVLGTPVGLR